MSGMYVTVDQDEVQPWHLYLDNMQVAYVDLDAGIKALRQLADTLEANQRDGRWGNTRVR